MENIDEYSHVTVQNIKAQSGIKLISFLILF